MVRARKRFGQHFLEPAWVRKLVDAIAPLPDERFIEIGPGHGAITVPLAERVERLVAVEVDRDLAAALAGRKLPNVSVVTADVLDADLIAIARGLSGPTSVPPDSTPVPPDSTSVPASATSVPPDSTPVPASATSVPAAPTSVPAAPTSVPTPPTSVPAIRVAGNLPYNISSPILFRLLDAAKSGLFKDATLMLQKEVADRLVARPGTGEYGVLTLSAAIGADVTRLLTLPPGAFRPAPKVQSAVVRLTFRPPPDDVTDPDLLVRIVRSVFTQRRKTVANALNPLMSAMGANAAEMLRRAGIDPTRRPETLTLSEYARLTQVVAVL